MADNHLCANCLDAGAWPFAIGPMQGHQMDQYQPTHDLCPACSEALSSGDFGKLSERFRSERLVSRLPTEHGPYIPGSR